MTGGHSELELLRANVLCHARRTHSCSFGMKLGVQFGMRMA